MDMETIMKMMLQSGALDQVSGMLGVDGVGSRVCYADAP